MEVGKEKQVEGGGVRQNGAVVLHWGKGYVQGGE